MAKALVGIDIFLALLHEDCHIVDIARAALLTSCMDPPCWYVLDQ